MEGMKEVEFEVKVTGKGWMFIPEEEDPKQYIEEATAQLGGNKLWDAKVTVKNIVPRKER